MAPRWIEEIEKCFTVLGCSDAEKVTLAVYQLQEIAHDWWRATRVTVFPEGVVPNWNAFSEAFIGKFFSAAAQEQKQEDSEMGYNLDLRSQPVALDPQNYEELYRRGQPIERDMRERRKIAPGPRFVPRRDNRNFGKRPMMNNGRFIPPVKKGIGKPTRPNNRNRRLCGRRHGNGPCPGRGGACFRCGKMGHHVRRCTEKAPGDFPQMVRPQGGPRIGAAPQGSQNRPPAQGRVYAVARKDTENASGVVTGTVLLCGHAAYALFDPGASHSFVSAQFADLAGIELKPLEVVLHVATPLKNEALVSLGCQNRKIVIGDSEELIDLAVLPMYDFDVIVGMDWLGKLKAVVDCGSRAIQFFPYPEMESQWIPLKSKR
ncbi:uncharacterized protein LOC115733672 [Rhodamnia argentea]|uniref:Uncharacterized protein LOC115733672 n=1 Tax=Rhodamnia argentea TaxID=178133 RepID=A0ABM3GYI1_9MYRT|nr:uncharacterized protein LOC115733672 [Rhodamnia argentea]